MIWSDASRRVIVVVALACTYACGIHFVAGCGREDVPLDPDDDGGEELGGSSDARPSDAGDAGS
jgi:hypothetical protein